MSKLVTFQTYPSLILKTTKKTQHFKLQVPACSRHELPVRSLEKREPKVLFFFWGGEDTAWRLRRKKCRPFFCWMVFWVGDLGMSYHHTLWIVGQIIPSPMVGQIQWRGSINHYTKTSSVKSSREICLAKPSTKWLMSPFSKHPRHLKGMLVNDDMHPLLLSHFLQALQLLKIVSSQLFL